MKKKGSIVFWILFPLLVLILGAIMIFYFDLANGPLYLFIIECGIFVAFVVSRILLRGRIFLIRVIPFLTFVIATAIIVPFAKPAIEVKSAANYSNPVATDVLTLKSGQVKGVYNKDQDVEIFAGIPYAKAPVGELRWKEPEPVDNWLGVKDCSNFAPREMQSDNWAPISTLVDMYAEKGWHPDYNMYPLQNMSEDCLYLNIWRPANISTNLPILVYIHGGSLTSGSSASDDFNGEAMAKTGVIMITIQYRLGIFGYFAHEQLAKESENNTTGNYGLLDQIQALKWIRENASYFKGQMNNITIAGESAGSSSVSALCTSPLAKGLFSKAIGESSSLVVKVPPHTYRSKETALKMGENIMKEYNCSSIEEMRKIPAEKLLNSKYTNSEMTLDGYALTKDPYQVYVDGENNETALLNGYNIKEADAFVIPQYLLSPTNKNNILERLQKVFGKVYALKFYELFKEEIDKDAFSTFNNIFSIYWFMFPHYSWMNMAHNNGTKVYSYQFTKENGFHGTYHAGEIIYAYGNVKNDKHSYRYDEYDLDLSKTMLHYWSNFAVNGNPNSSSLPVWEQYDPAEERIMELGSTVAPKYIDKLTLSAFDLCEEYVDYLLKNPNHEEAKL